MHKNSFLFLTRLSLLPLIVFGSLLLFLEQNARAESPKWPDKPIKLIVGFPAGSSPDLTARLLAEPISQKLGVPVIVENKVGAAGNIAADFVSKARDEHTLGLMINGNMTIAKRLNPKLNYDPEKDFTPLSLIGVAPLVLVAPNDWKLKNANDSHDFFQALRKQSQELNYGSPGIGTVSHLGMELLKGKTHIQALHIPYAGNSQVAVALINQEIHLALLPPALAQAQMKVGKLKAIGVTSATRSVLLPEIPSLNETGLQGFDLEIWNAITAPAQFPADKAQYLSALISEIVRTPVIREKLFTQGWQAVGTSAEGLQRRIQSDSKLLGDLIERQKIRAE